MNEENRSRPDTTARVLFHLREKTHEAGVFDCDVDLTPTPNTILYWICRVFYIFYYPYIKGSAPS